MKKLILAMLLLSASTAFADDGDTLLHACQIALRDNDSGFTMRMSHQDKFYEGACMGAVHGVVDTAYFLGVDFGIDVPERSTLDQNVRVVVKYLQEHPEELHERDTVLIIRALRHAFPHVDKK